MVCVCEEGFGWGGRMRGEYCARRPGECVSLKRVELKRERGCGMEMGAGGVGGVKGVSGHGG